jgi:hypothetical protein
LELTHVANTTFFLKKEFLFFFLFFFFFFFFLASALARNFFCNFFFPSSEISARPVKSLQNFPMKSNPKNPPKILRQPHYQKIPTKHQKTPTKYQKITNNHQKSLSFPHEIQSRKSPKNPPSTHITKKYQQNTKKYQQSPTITKNQQQKPKITKFLIRELKEKKKKKKKKKTKKNEKKTSKNAGKTPPWLHRRRAMTLRTPAPSSTTALSHYRSSSLSFPFHLPVCMKKKMKRKVKGGMGK